MDKRIMLFDVSSATVKEASIALNCSEGMIAKTLSFFVKNKAILIVIEGSYKIDNSKYKKEFGCKAKMIDYVNVEAIIGHKAGGVCPFGINDGVRVFLDESLKRFDIVYPACGSSNSAVELSCEELEKLSACEAWIDVCKNWEN